MFTGIIEEKGKINRVVWGTNSCRVTIEAKKIFEDLKIGDSIAVNGICLTACEINAPLFTADVMSETVRRTSLNNLKNGQLVNLERAMLINGRFGGHIVSGHIDGTGTIINMVKEENAIWITLSAESTIIRYIVEKGSVALDGISLTVAKVNTDTFAVSVIPHTVSETILSEKSIGSKINIECDIIGKYVEKFSKEKKGITEDFLKKYGF